LQEARLDYRLLAAGERYSLLSVNLHTGRHHQIRAQLKAAGMVIKGDLKYGAARSNPDGGICLHAFNLVLEHPVGTGKPLVEIWADPRQVQADRLWDILLPEAFRLQFCGRSTTLGGSTESR
jgi:23S rRNA pseudouridine1911/1915/1917 synthase